MVSTQYRIKEYSIGFAKLQKKVVLLGGIHFWMTISRHMFRHQAYIMKDYFEAGKPTTLKDFEEEWIKKNT